MQFHATSHTRTVSVCRNASADLQPEANGCRRHRARCKYAQEAVNLDCRRVAALNTHHYPVTPPPPPPPHTHPDCEAVPTAWGHSMESLAEQVIGSCQWWSLKGTAKYVCPFAEMLKWKKNIHHASSSSTARLRCKEMVPKSDP